MDLIKDLEQKVNNAIELIAKLKKDNESLIRENDSLKSLTEKQGTQVENLKLQAEQNAELMKKAKADFDPVLVKEKLQKLVQRLGALEETWN